MSDLAALVAHLDGQADLLDIEHRHDRCSGFGAAARRLFVSADAIRACASVSDALAILRAPEHAFAASFAAQWVALNQPAARDAA